ncbi:MAG TPA: YbaK/EbsC family protein [Tianweitania sediminis]|jgi:Ala-tRNA(Pro) deacylase|nr:YbaK/EbsC family protein [Tianweitania sediminis]
MGFDREGLETFLAEQGIAVQTVDHPALHTVAESRDLRGEIGGAHTKNLFLKDKKGRYFLLTVDEAAEVDLKSVHHLIGASGKVSFGKPDALHELLGVLPGAVTVFGAINDRDHLVTVVIDSGLMQNDIINAHPLVNTATTSIKRDDLLRFLEAVDHTPLVLKIAA